MQIIPKFGEQPLTASNVTISVNSEDRDRALALVELTKSVTEVTNEETFAEARQVAGQLKAMLDEIEAARKQAKQPFAAVARTVDQVASDASAPLKDAQNRILGMLAGHVAKLEAARKERERLEAEAKRIAQEEAMRKVKEATSEREKAQAELALDLVADIEELGMEAEPPKGLVPGGRVDHVYEFTLVDVAAAVKAGCWRLLRWELDILACRDAVKNLVEMNPNAEPELPGIRVTKKLNVSVKAASRIK